MFGNNSWTNPQQNQQQQQPGTSAFGQQQQPAAFGSGGTGAAFGGGGFGQNNQQPANPMFGGAASTTNTGTPSFGAFGGGGTSAFGAPKPTGFGAFGGGTTGTSAFGGGAAFGQNTPGAGASSAFGQPTGSTSAFGGTGTGLFGQKPAAPTGTFGSTSTGPNTTGTDGNSAPVTTGSSNPPYNPFQEKDSNAGTNSNITLQYQSISTMPAYRGTSFEELRVQDYAQGRKTAGGFGQSATFGLQPSQSTATGFGQPSATTSTFGFGQNNQQPPTQPTNAFGTFGQQPSGAQPPVFGSGAGTSAFGAFGQNTQQQQQPTGTGLFGGPSAFGQNNPQQQQQHQPAATGFGGFGQNTNQPKPFGGFGQTSGAGAFGGGGAFGQNTTQPAAQTTGLFGQPAQPNQGTTAFGGFGANQNKPAFGQPASQPTTGAFGLFGQNNQQQQQPQGQQPSTGLFGGGTPGTNLFGQNQQQQQGQQGQQGAAQPSIGLFGQQPSQPSTNLFSGGAGTNLFGNPNNQNKPAFGPSLFGTNNQGANLGIPQPSTGLFGQQLGQATTQQAPGTNAFGGASMFGQKPATATFGQSTSQPASTGLGSSLFGASALGGTGGGFGQSVMGVGGGQGTGTLTASVAQPVQENLPIFSLLRDNSQAASLAPPPKKTSNFFVDVPTRSALGISSARLTNAGKLRGFGVSQSAAGLTRNNGLQASLALSRKGANSLALSRGGSRSLLGPDSFLGSPSLGSNGTSSPKKLVLNKKIDPSEVFGRSMAKAAPSGAGGKVEFSPTMSMAAREKEVHPLPSVSRPAPSAASPARKSTTLEKEPSELQEGDYFVKPPLEVLRKLSNRELSSFRGLTVGRKGYGEVEFLDPVDLTALPRLRDLLGKLVEIKNKEVIINPDSAFPDGDKPGAGEGINVRGKITLYNCWARDKATGEDLKDPTHPAYVKHKRRLEKMKRTYGSRLDDKTGTWEFVVDHF